MSISADKHFKKTQSGRSMIEMLGVLAIIGVLSVGGIAGYTKAMTKYKINKTIDQVTQLAQNIRAYYATQKNYSSLGSEVMKKAHLAPDEMYNSAGGLESPFGGGVYVHSWSKYINSDDRKAFVIRMFDVPEEACVELLTQDWGVGSSSGLIAVGAGSSAYHAALGGEGEGSIEGHYAYPYGPTYDPIWVGGQSGYLGSDYVTFASEGVMGLDKAARLCENSSEEIMWKFY